MKIEQQYLGLEDETEKMDDLLRTNQEMSTNSLFQQSLGFETRIFL